jgi:hypothetical protein
MAHKEFSKTIQLDDALVAAEQTALAATRELQAVPDRQMR